jgi:integrase/recombinase XerD
MNDLNLLAPWIKRFLADYLVTVRCVARSTQLSYRDTLARLIRYAAGELRTRPDLLKLDDISRDLINRFLPTATTGKAVGARTVNQRLAAIHSFARFVGEYGPEHLEWSGRVLAIPFRKFARPEIPYLEKPEMDALLAAADLRTAQGMRDHALLMFLYNTGARATEVAQVKVEDLQLQSRDGSGNAFVRLLGKGNKVRLCPLWPQTAAEISALIVGRPADQHAFLNRRGTSITRFGVHSLVERCAKRIEGRFPAVGAKRVSPHTIRHTTATYLLRSGVDINTIRAWLGHVSLNTTNIYAQIDLEMKSRALAQLQPSGEAPRRRMESDMLQFLRSL